MKTTAALFASSCWLYAQPGGLPRVEEIRIERYLAAPMRDGVKLYGDLYRPARDGKFPVLIVRTPYGVQRDGVHEALIKYAQNGYAVYVQDVRGRYESEGKWDPFRNEANDGYDTIEWAAKQPWSNGKVGLEGGSYLGHISGARPRNRRRAWLRCFPPWRQRISIRTG